MIACLLAHAGRCSGPRIPKMIALFRHTSRVGRWSPTDPSARNCRGIRPLRDAESEFRLPAPPSGTAFARASTGAAVHAWRYQLQSDSDDWPTRMHSRRATSRDGAAATSLVSFGGGGRRGRGG
eukprot:scaffold1954_cov113-Isochrysis_galbana.AAC.4